MQKYLTFVSQASPYSVVAVLEDRSSMQHHHIYIMSCMASELVMFLNNIPLNHIYVMNMKFQNIISKSLAFRGKSQDINLFWQKQNYRLYLIDKS